MRAAAQRLKPAHALRMRSIRVCLPAMMALMHLACAVRPALAATNADALLDLGAFRGKVVYLDFWASWCAPCRESFPWMNRLEEQFAREGLVVIAVNVDRDRAEAERFLRAHPADFRIVFDPDGLLPDKFGVRGMPTSVLIDRQGEVRLRHEGFFVRESDQLKLQVQKLLLAH
jgi:cytochrome c biogenesis protein CcmG/thiol:disulfide interchange protein DsbE